MAPSPDAILRERGLLEAKQEEAMLDPSVPDTEEKKNARSFQINRLVRQSAFLLSSGAVSYAGALVLNVLLARILGVVGFGAWAVAFSTTLTVSTVALLGADWILIRNGSYFESAGDHLRLRRLIHIALALGGSSLMIAGAGLFVLAPVIATGIFHDASVEPLLRVAAVTAPVIGIQQIMLNGTRAFKSVKELVLINNLAQPILRLLAVGVALLVLPSATSAFIGLLVAELFLAVAAAVALNHRVHLIGPTERVSLRETLNFGLPAWGTRLAESFRKELFPILLASISGFAAGGAYAAGKRISGAPSSVLNSLLRVYTPIAGDLYLQKRRDELTTLFQNLGKWSLALAFPLFCFLVAFPKEILSLFGEGFTDTSSTLVVLAIAMLFAFGTGPVTVTLIVSGRPRLALVDYVLVVAVEIGVALWLIPDIGVLGAAVAKLVGTAVNNVLPLIQVWRLEGMQPYRLDYWKPVAAGVGGVIVARGVAALLPVGGALSAAIAGLALGLSYVAFMYFLGLSEEDRVAISTLLRRTTLKEPVPPTADMPAVE